jgi:CheY-like chemotaxis protein
MVETATKTVFVLEDNAVEREGLTAVLRSHGHNVVAAEDAEEALDLLHDGPPPDLILLDMLLPRRDGWWFLKQRRKSTAIALTPFIVVTGLGIANDEWAASLGASGLLRKPIDVDALLALVNRE